MTARNIDKMVIQVEAIRTRHDNRQRMDGTSTKIKRNGYKTNKKLDIIRKSGIIKLHGGFRGDDGPDTWITTESGAHIPLDKNGVAMGGAGGWAKGKSFSSAKGSSGKGGGSGKGGSGGSAPSSATGSSRGSAPVKQKGDDELLKSTADKVAETKANIETIMKENHDSWRRCRQAYENGERIPSGGKAEEDSTLKNSSEEAQKAYDKARESEAQITHDLVGIASQSGTEMYGLDYSVKTAKSVEEKIGRKNEQYAKIGIKKSDAETVREMGDLVRYTQLCDHDKIADTAKATLSSLRSKGYEITEVDNKWMDKGSTYKGLHIAAKDKRGQTFELQIHSPESMMVKEQNHVQYEVSRKPETSPYVKRRLEEEMANRSAGMRIPKGMDDPALKTWKKKGA